MTTTRSICRVCGNHCAILVETDGDRVTRVTGDPDDPLYRGYTCVKGRAQPAVIRSPERLLRPLERQPDGTVRAVPVEAALDAIAERLQAIVDRHGPRSVAAYTGTMAYVTALHTGAPLLDALMDGLGSVLRFDPNTIDKGGKQVAASLLGTWLAPPMGFDRPDAILLIGANPLVTYTGFPAGNPGRWLGDQLRRGAALVVIDPRRSDVARRADIHLQPAPGHDAELLAAMIRVVLDEDLVDDDFVTAHVTGVDELRAAVDPFDPGRVARAAGIEAPDLVAAARTYGRARRGYAFAGTGPSMAATGTVVEYLVLALETLLGRWLRAGDRLPVVPTLGPRPEPRAEAVSPEPSWATGPAMRVRGLTGTRAGLPVAALPEEILEPGEGRVRALLSWGGNPALAFPDQRRAVAALDDLELLVQLDPWPSATARRAHYVLPPPLPLEVPGTTAFLDLATGRAAGYGLGTTYANATAAVVPPPPGSDLVEEWRAFAGLLDRLGLPLRVRPLGAPPGSPTVDIEPSWSTEELLERLLAAAGARIGLGALRAAGRASTDGGDPIVVAPARAGAAGRLEVGSRVVLDALDELAAGRSATADDDGGRRFRLVCRRPAHVYNSSMNVPATHRGRPGNRALLHPDDLAGLGIDEGATVEIQSSVASVRAVVAADPNLRPGLVAMAFGYGDPDDPEADPRLVGTSPSRLVPVDEVYDPFIGQPRMSNLPVDVLPVAT